MARRVNVRAEGTDQTYWYVILVEHNVVGESNVVDPGDALASLDGDSVGVKLQSTTVFAQLDVGSVCAQSKAKSCETNSGSLCDACDLLAERSSDWGGHPCACLDLGWGSQSGASD